MNDRIETKGELIIELKEISFDDVFDKTNFQHLQDLFANAHGVASIITDTEGNPITQPSNYTRLCENCFRSYKVIGRSDSKGAIVQTCLKCGLLEAGASITIGGKHIANWMIGVDKEDFQATLKEVPVILLTSLSNPLDIIKGLQSGADNFITKPYEEQYLLSRIHYLLANRDLRAGGSAEMVIEIIFRGEKFKINSEKKQILDLLLSVYEAAVERNDQLSSTQAELMAANEIGRAHV